MYRPLVSQHKFLKKKEIIDLNLWNYARKLGEMKFLAKFVTKQVRWV